MTEVALEQFGKIDVLVNDAGIIGVSQWVGAGDSKRRGLGAGLRR